MDLIAQFQMKKDEWKQVLVPSLEEQQNKIFKASFNFLHTYDEYLSLTHPLASPTLLSKRDELLP